MIYITKEVRRFPFCHRACLKISVSGMMSTWNKFCFTGGYIEANVSLPGLSNVLGLWPAIWTMGNLGRAGYGASLEGMVRLDRDLSVAVALMNPCSSPSSNLCHPYNCHVAPVEHCFRRA